MQLRSLLAAGRNGGKARERMGGVGAVACGTSQEGASLKKGASEGNRSTRLISTTALHNASMYIMDGIFRQSVTRERETLHVCMRSSSFGGLKVLDYLKMQK